MHYALNLGFGIEFTEAYFYTDITENDCNFT